MESSFNRYDTLTTSHISIIFSHPCVCRIELSNTSYLTDACKRGSVEVTDTVRQRGLESSLRHTQGDWNFVLNICFIYFTCTLIIELYISYYVTRNTTESTWCDLMLLYLPYKEYHTCHGKRHLPYKEMS